MDCFCRLKGVGVFLFVALFSFFLPTASFAVGEFAATPQRNYNCNTNGPSYSGTSLTAVAAKCLPPAQSFEWGNVSYGLQSCSETTASSGIIKCPYKSYTVYCPKVNGVRTCETIIHEAVAGNIDVAFNTSISCGDNATSFTKNGAMQCSCNATYMAKNGKCEQYTCPPSGGYSAVTQPDQKVPNAGDSVCTGGCGYKPSSWKVGQDGQIWATWPFKSTGSFCGGDKAGSTPVDTGEKNSQNPAPVACGANQCPGTVNGATICVPCKKTSTDGPSTSASSPTASASSPAGTSTSHSCDGVSCTTTTITKDGSGNVIGQVDKTEDQASFCKENPQSPLCKPSAFGGACAATTCEGDAVACAIAADQYKRNCQWFDDPDAQQNAVVGNAAINGQLRPDGHPANDAEGVSVNFSSAIDQTDRLGSGCPADVSVNVAGKAVVMPFSSMCGNLQLVGSLMVGFCMFCAALIVFRG